MLKKRGVVLITVLLLMILLALLGMLLVVTGKASFTMGAGFYERQAALAAAQSGVEYAMARLESDRYWGTDGSRVMDYDLGEGKSFSLAFCDDSELKYPSVNNLTGESGVLAGTVLEAGAHNVTCPRDVPANSALIIVEGTCGQVSRYVEVLFKYAGPASLDCSAIATNQMEINLTADGRWDVFSSVGTPTAIRSNLKRQDVPSITMSWGNPPVFDENAIDKLDLNGGTALAPGSLDLPQNCDGTLKEGSNSLKIPDLEFDQLAQLLEDKIEASGSKLHKVDGGIYEFTSSSTVNYYAVEPGSTLPATPTKTYSWTMGEDNQISLKDWKMVINKPFRVSGAVKGFEVGATSSQQSKVVKLVLNKGRHDKVDPGLITNLDGNLRIRGQAVGTGLLVSGGDLTLEGQSVLNPKSMDLALFAQQDIVLNYTSMSSGIGAIDPELSATPEFLFESLGATQTNTSQSTVEVNVQGKPILTGNTEVTYEVSDTPVSGTAYQPKTFAGFLIDKINQQYSQSNSNQNTVGPDTKLAKLLSIASKDFSWEKDKLKKEYMATEDFQAIWGGTRGANALFVTSLNAYLKSATVSPKDTYLGGLVYTKKNFIANMEGNSFSVAGALVVNGDWPEGKLEINKGKKVEFTYVPEKLKILDDYSSSCRVNKVFWALRK